MIVAIYGGELGSDSYLNNHYYYLTMLGRFDQLLIGMVFGYLYINHKDKFANPIFIIASSAIVFFSLLTLRSEGLWYIPTPYVTSW